MTTAIDPTRVVSSGLLLSEFVGNQSVYYYGIPNPVQSDVWVRSSEVVLNFQILAAMLQDIHVIMGSDNEDIKAFSISYGWIHPRLSERIVKWKSPTVPSYHRWDMGAACDINFHSITYVPYHYVPSALTVAESNRLLSPLAIAAAVNGGARPGNLDRTITYSESPYICFGTAVPDTPSQGKWYENRFEGVRGVKPLFITYRSGRSNYGSSPASTLPRPLDIDWRGGGWPSHHGGGKCQYHHIRTSLYTVMSDWLYDRDRVHFGQANRMPMSTARYETLKRAMHFAGAVFDIIQAVTPGHVAIIAGLKMAKRTSNWESEEVWTFTVTSPGGDTGFYSRIVDEVFPQYREALGILACRLETPRNYLTPVGRPISGNMQTRVTIIGSYNATGNEHFNFETAARSADFREGQGERDRDSDSETEGVARPHPRTQRRRAEGGSRRSIRTRTFRGRD